MIPAEHLTTDEQLDTLGWRKVTDGLAKPMILDAAGIVRIWYAGIGKWRVADSKTGLWSEKAGEHPSLEAAVLVAYNANKKPEPDARQPLDTATFRRLLEEGHENMKAFEADRKAGFPRVITAGVGVTVKQDEDRCETSQADLDASDLGWRLREIIANFAAVTGETEAAIKADNGRDVCYRLGARLLAANNRANAAEKLLGGEPVATFDGRTWHATIGSIDFMLASMEGEKSANVYWGINTMLKVTGASRGEVNQHVTDLLAFRGIRVQE